jgi:ATP-dependent Lhr-like helicase
VNAEQVAREIDSTESCLLFTNTRSQAELWYQALSEVRPAWHGCLALHHGSLSREEREAAEAGLQSGALRCVVCTSSLDLGVDFSPVDLVVQIGSPKGVGRLLQRAGRSGHRPGAISRVLCVPTNAFELVEFSAAREAAEARQVEPRIPLEKPLDLLVQHLLTIGLGGGFTREEVLGEVQGAWAFRNLTDQELGWALDFLTHGGPALKAYPQYARLGLLRGRYVPVSDQTGKSHRLSIGTITSDSSIAIRFQRGATLGAVEEYFIARLKPGDRFLFAGRPLELIGVRGMVAEVRRATGKATAVPQWMGGKMPLSTLLADRVRGRLHAAREGSAIDREMEWVTPIIAAQEKLSHLPAPGELLIETVRTREGHHAFLFAFAGRAVHEGLGALIAHRLTQQNPRSISIMVNDYGLQLLSSKPLDFSETEWREVLASDRLHEDLLRCMNTTELAKRRFRDVARVAGLIIEGFPGTRKSTKQLQISSSLLFDVFSQFDPGNMLLEQARREVLRDQLDVRQMEACLTRLEGEQLVLKTPKRLAPMAFPLWAESIRTHVSNETWEEKVAGMLQQMDEALR